MIERLFLTLLLLLGAICAVTDIPDDYLDDLLSDMNKEVREMMTGSEFVGYTNVSYSRVYSKQTAPDIMEIGMRCVAFARASKYLAKRYVSVSKWLLGQRV